MLIQVILGGTRENRFRARAGEPAIRAAEK
jgi:hypothetical protein